MANDKVWFQDNGKIKLSEDESKILFCDECPCNACDITTTSFLVRQTDGGSGEFSPTTVTKGPWPWSCGSPSTLPCIWAGGPVASGAYAGKLVAVHGGESPTDWFILFKNSDCTGIVNSGPFFGTGPGPEGDYANNMTVE